MPLRKAFSVPHPPLLVEAVGGASAYEVQDSLAAIKQIADVVKSLEPATIVITSPHAPYLYDRFFVDKSEKTSGSFARFARPDVGLTKDNDVDFIERLAAVAEEAGLRLALGSAELDHGVLVPLSFIDAAWHDYKLVRIGLSEKSRDDQVRLGQIIRRLLDESDAPSVFIASGDLSHYLKSDGPYGLRPEGQLFDDHVRAIIESGDLKKLLAIPPHLVEDAGQCAYHSLLILLGVLGKDPVKTTVLAYDNHFGVGYLTSVLSPNENLLSQSEADNTTP